LTGRHRKHVIFQHRLLPDREHERDPNRVRRELRDDPSSLSRCCDIECFRMQPQREPRPDQHRTPRGQMRAHRFNIVRTQAIAMMAQMIDLHRVHRSEHQNAECEHHEFGCTARNS